MLLKRFWKSRTVEIPEPEQGPEPAEPAETPAETMARLTGEIFPHAYGLMPAYTNGLTLLPPDHKHIALVVPIDGEYVISTPRRRAPYASIERDFAEREQDFDRFLQAIEPYRDLSGLPDHDIDGVTPFHPNPFFGPTDASVLSGIIGRFKPRRYVEIGSGNSTRFARRAIGLYATGCRITCIDPAPRTSIRKIADTIIEKSVLDADLQIFEQLEAGDVLFFDGSHHCFHGTDTNHFFFEILPRIKPGVLVHLHDIYLPHEYPERCDRLFWTEQYVLAAFLAGNAEWMPVCPVQHLYMNGHCQEGASFWMVRGALPV